MMLSPNLPNTQIPSVLGGRVVFPPLDAVEGRLLTQLGGHMEFLPYTDNRSVVPLADTSVAGTIKVCNMFIPAERLYLKRTVCSRY